MELLLLLVPFITSAVMFGYKALSGLYLIDNNQHQKGWLRAALVMTTFVAVLLQNAIAGTMPDSQTVSQAVTDLIMIVVETGVLSYFAHAFYNSAFRRPTA